MHLIEKQRTFGKESYFLVFPLLKLYNLGISLSPMVALNQSKLTYPMQVDAYLQTHDVNSAK